MLWIWPKLANKSNFVVNIYVKLTVSTEHWSSWYGNSVLLIMTVLFTLRTKTHVWNWQSCLNLWWSGGEIMSVHLLTMGFIIVVDFVQMISAPNFCYNCLVRWMKIINATLWNNLFKISHFNLRTQMVSFQQQLYFWTVPEKAHNPCDKHLLTFYFESKNWQL